MSPAGCPHVGGFKVGGWRQNLRLIYQCFVWSGSAETRTRKVSAGVRSSYLDPRCACCGDVRASSRFESRPLPQLCTSPGYRLQDGHMHMHVHRGARRCCGPDEPAPSVVVQSRFP